MSNTKSGLSRVNHIVVLMLENRSFDNVLGWLYDPANQSPFDRAPRGQSFEGVSGKDLSNPRPDGGINRVGRGSSYTDPFPDPFEPYAQVFAQMYNRNPPPVPVPATTESPDMQGFVINYAAAIDEASKSEVGGGGAVDPGIIMNCFTPAQLPVISGLANAYAVCDHWFSSVPTQTFANRSFVHAATSSGYVVNSWKTGKHFFDIGVLMNDTPTIYNRLEDAGVNWRIYYGGPFLLCNALLIQDRLRKFILSGGDHFSHMDRFYEDVRRPNGLPAYTFIEPNLMCSRKYGPENDMHPAYAVTDTGTPTNVLYGEELIYKVYDALRNSPDWESTLLVIVFDEHGGCYDHVSTPLPFAVPPDDLIIPVGHPGYSGFTFNRYGVRVPAVLVSPLIEPGTVCNTVFDHTSIIKTATNRWGLASLTRRDAAANDLSEVLTLSQPRTDAPSITPIPAPPFEGCDERPISKAHWHLLAAASRLVAKTAGELVDLHHIETTEQATAALDEREERVRSSG
ncbi:MAG: phospholipase [Acidobacteriota bacterium]|nr:phospholipase [Acidobacteriota bacterium]